MHTLRGDKRLLHYQPYLPFSNEDLNTSFDTECVEIAAALSLKMLYLIILFDFDMLHIRRIPNNDIKTTLIHDSIELDEPVKWLVTFTPLCEPPFIFFDITYVALVNPILECEITIQFIFQFFETLD